MRRLLVLLSFASLTSFVVAAGGVGAIGCGGNDKPPLTPDGVESTAQDLADAGPTPAGPNPSSPQTMPPAK